MGGFSDVPYVGGSGDSGGGDGFAVVVVVVSINVLLYDGATGAHGHACGCGSSVVVVVDGLDGLHGLHAADCFAIKVADIVGSLRFSGINFGARFSSINGVDVGGAIAVVFAGFAVFVDF